MMMHVLRVFCSICIYTRVAKDPDGNWNHVYLGARFLAAMQCLQHDCYLHPSVLKRETEREL